MKLVVIIVVKGSFESRSFWSVFAQADQSQANLFSYFDKSVLVNNRHQIFVNNHTEKEKRNLSKDGCARYLYVFVMYLLLEIDPSFHGNRVTWTTQCVMTRIVDQTLWSWTWTAEGTRHPEVSRLIWKHNTLQVCVGYRWIHSFLTPYRQ